MFFNIRKIHKNFINIYDDEFVKLIMEDGVMKVVNAKRTLHNLNGMTKIRMKVSLMSHYKRNHS
jgi:hypothetical protein